MKCEHDAEDKQSMFQLSFGLEFGLYSVSGEWTRARAPLSSSSYYRFVNVRADFVAVQSCKLFRLNVWASICWSFVICSPVVGFFSLSLVCSQCLAISRAKAYNPFKFKAHHRTYIQIIHYIGNHSLTFCYKYMKCAIGFFFIGWLFCVEHVHYQRLISHTSLSLTGCYKCARECVSKCVSFATWTKVFGFEWDRFNQRLWCWCWFCAPCEILLANSVGRTSAYT